MILFFTMQGVIQCRTATGYDNELNERKELHVILMFYLKEKADESKFGPSSCHRFCHWKKSTNTKKKLH